MGENKILNFKDITSLKILRDIMLLICFVHREQLKRYNDLKQGAVWQNYPFLAEICVIT
jgi:hypothetical protein